MADHNSLGGGGGLTLDDLALAVPCARKKEKWVFAPTGDWEKKIGERARIKGGWRKEGWGEELSLLVNHFSIHLFFLAPALSRSLALSPLCENVSLPSDTLDRARGGWQKAFALHRRERETRLLLLLLHSVFTHYYCLLCSSYYYCCAWSIARYKSDTWFSYNSFLTKLRYSLQKFRYCNIYFKKILFLCISRWCLW